MSAPPRVRAHLLEAADGPTPVLHRGPDAVYVDVAGRCVGVVGTHATAVPCALRTGLERLGPAVRAHVAGGVLHLDDQPLRIGRILDVQVPRLVARGSRVGLTSDEVATMVGAGDGLTPYGDDVLCGWLAMHRAAEVATPEVDAAIRGLADRTTLLSATLLDCAMHGEVIPEFALFVAALGTPSEAGRAATLAAVGHSSGRGLLAGARRALADLDIVAVAASTPRKRSEWRYARRPLASAGTPEKP